MKKPDIPENEAERLSELLSFSILDTIEEADFDALTRLASQICGTPIALVSIIDSSRQWFKSHHGLDAQETPREYAFCAHAINRPDEMLVVPDATADERFHDNPLVTGDSHVIFYAGCPLVSNNGFPLGTLCLIDHRPRELSDEQLRAVSDIARQVVNLLELRRVNTELSRSLDKVRSSSTELDAFFAVNPNLLIIANTDGMLLRVNPAFTAVVGHSEEELLSRPLLEFVRPEDIEATVNALSVLAEGKDVVGFRNRYVHADGGHVTLEWYARAVGKTVYATARDVTVLEDTEKQLLRTNEFLDMAGQMAKVGYWEINLKDSTLFWSDMTRQIQEVPDDFVPELEQGINFYKEGKSRDTITQAVEKALASGEPYDVELELVTPKGKVKWVRAKGATEFKDGVCVRSYGTFQDIDERKRAELLQEQFIAEAPVAIAMLDSNMRYIAASQKWLADYGLEGRQVKGVSHYDMFPEIGEEWKQIHRECLSGTVQQRHEDPFPRADGSLMWLKWKVQPWYRAENEVGGLIMFTEDITAAKQVTEQLRISEEQFRGSFEHAAIGMARVGTDGSWLRVNRSLCDMLGYSEQELMGLTFQEITHPEDLNTDLSFLKELAAGQRTSYQMEKRYFHKNGSIIHVLLAVSVVRNGEGHPLYYVSQITDFTARKTAESRLQETLVRTEAQNRRLKNFSHIVSHNLRSHYSNIAMLVDVLQTDFEGSEGNEVLSFLRQANDNLGETITHLNDVVIIGLFENESLRLCNLRKAAAMAAEIVSADAVKANVAVTLDPSDELHVMAVPAYLDSILLNLIGNAIRYSSPERDSFVKVVFKRVKDKVRISVSDNGLGIDLKIHGAKLFGMYRTFHSRKDSRGLGLFITKNQVEAMQGHITVDSTPDVGTTFTVTLKSSAL